MMLPTYDVRAKPAMMGLLVSLWLFGGTAQASNEAEKAVLVRVIHELDALNPLLQEANESALMDTRIRLNYTWLRQDLERVKSGIKDYIEEPSTEPRSFPPLKGDYRQ